MIPERFCTYLADTEYAQQLHHHLRYQVFCARKQYEDGIHAGALAQERDDYDSVAARFLIKDELLDTWIGTARLVPNDHHPLPAESLGAINAREARLLARHRTAEVSRLATVSAYQSSASTARLLQSVILSLMTFSQREGIEWLVFLVSPGMARMLGRLGTPMEICGPAVEHRGIRRAYRSHIKTGIEMVPWMSNVGRSGCAQFSMFEERQKSAA